MVMPIDVLGSLAQLRPTTVVHLAAIEGVGDQKAKTYGPIFTDAIQVGFLPRAFHFLFLSNTMHGKRFCQWHGTPTDVHSHKQQQQHLEKGAVVAVPPSPPISTTIGCPEIARLERVAAVPTFHTPPHSSIVPQRFSVEEPVQKLCGKRMADELGRNLLRFQTSSSHAPKAKFVRHSGNKIGTTTPGSHPECRLNCSPPHCLFLLARFLPHSPNLRQGALQQAIKGRTTCSSALFPAARPMHS